jgi:hypothetical protein
VGVTVRTPEIDEAIVSGISQGIPLAQICRGIGIDRTIVYDWRKLDTEFDQRIARAREIGFDAIADDCLAIADDTTHDTKIVGEDEREVANTEWISRSKLRVETRLKLLAKWDPKRYGERMTHAGDEAAPIHTKSTIDLKNAPDEVLRYIAGQAIADDNG